MATQDIYAEPIAARVDLVWPKEEVPTEASAWLQDMGWQRVDTSSVATFFRKHGRWDGLYYRWYEAVALEQMNFITLGTRGEKQEDVFKDDAAGATVAGAHSY